jgi:lipopolysaccharide/colanic/teichoic acid biosynthesis glycosyltransferase
MSFYAAYLKRPADIVAAVFLIVGLLPVMALVGLLVWLLQGSPILYRDERAGRHGRPIRIVKFRSMRHHDGSAPPPLGDGDRLTAFGRLLRRSSLDELPQLFSVLSGDMSLIGPRPLPLRYVSRYDARQATRLSVRPGLTGWAQIHGRNAVDWTRRLEYDAQYVEILGHWWAPLADLWIVLATALQIVWQGVTGRGISAPGAATMQEFAP